MPLFPLTLLREKNVPEEKILHNFSQYLSLFEKQKILVTEYQAKKIGYPRKKQEKAVAFRKIISVKDEKCYEPLYDRSDQITFFLYEKIPSYYGMIGDVKKAGIEREGEPEAYTLDKGSLIGLYNLQTLLSKKGKCFMERKNVSFPYFTKMMIESIGFSEKEGRHVGYTIERRLEPVYKVNPSSVLYSMKTYRSKKEYLPHESEVYGFYGKIKEEELNECLVAIREETYPFGGYDHYVKIYNMKKLVTKAGFLYYEPKELEKKKNYALFTDREFQYFPKAWKVKEETYVIKGYTNYGKKVYELNEEGKALFPYINEKEPGDIVVSITQLKEVKELLNKENSAIAHMKLKGRTEDGKYIFDVSNMKYKNKIRLRLLQIAK